MPAYTNDELRAAIQRLDFTDEQCEEYRIALRVFIQQVLDHYYGPPC